MEETDSFNLENKSCIEDKAKQIMVPETFNIEDKAKQIMVPETFNIEDTGYGKSKPGSDLSIVVSH